MTLGDPNLLAKFRPMRLCGKHGCVRVQGHSSFCTTSEAVARRADESIDQVIAAAVNRHDRDISTPEVQ